MKQLLLVCSVVVLSCTSLFAQDGIIEIEDANFRPYYLESNTNNSQYFDKFEYDYTFGSYHLIPASQSVRYNRVDALFLGIGTDYNILNSNFITIGGVNIGGHVGYSIGQKNWQYRVIGTKKITNSLIVGAELQDVSTSDDYWRAGLTENSITSLVAGYDFYDYYRAEGYSFFTEVEAASLISLTGSYNYTQFSSVINNTDYSFFAGGNNERINPAIDVSTDAITQHSLGMRLSINKTGYSKGALTSKFKLEAQLADLAGFNNDFLYNKYEATSLNYLELDKNTLIKLRLMVGSITGTAPNFKNFALGGVGSLRATNYKAYQGDKMVLSNFEIVFGDHWKFDKRNIELSGLSLSIFLDSGWTSFNSNPSKDPLSGFDSFSFDELSHNVGAGIGGNNLRIEVATPVAGSEGYTSVWLRLNSSF